MITQSLRKAVQLIADELLLLARQVIDQSAEGTDFRLKDSLSASVEANANSVVISLLMDNYVEYIECGRKPRSGKMPPIDQLRDWAISRGISPTNDTLYAISYAIWRDGIEPRPVISLIEERIDKAFDQRWADWLMEAVVDDLVKYFNQ